jgi:dihydropteroate synthase
VQRLQTFQSVLARARVSHGAAILGVCNVTPNSFSDGGEAYGAEQAAMHIDVLLEQGADMIDIGGESTRPGAAPVDATEQLRRILDSVRNAAKRCFVSVDTTLPEVADACLAAGAHAVNDVSCARNPELARVVAKHEAVYMLMHARGTQAEMQGFSVYPNDGYNDVVEDVVREWTEASEVAKAQGVASEALVFDPGYGFAKNAEHSLTLLERTRELCDRVRVPVLSGASRKSFLRFADPDAAPNERLGASVAAACYAVRNGAHLVRVHDVRAVKQALRVECRLGAQRSEGTAVC